MTQFINDPTLPKPSFPGSHMVVDDHYMFISGLTVADLSNGEAARGDVKEETRLVMRELARMLEQEGGSLADVVRVDVHLTDLKQINALDSIYAEFFEPGRYPARTCTESPHICGGSTVEITLMAQRASATTTLPSASVVGGDAPPQWVPVQLVSYYVLNGYVQVHGTPLLTYCSSLDTFVTFCARVARRVGTLGAESHESWRVALLVNHKPQPLNDEMKTHLWALLLKEFQHLAKSPDREASFFQKADEYEYEA